jgi:hypothetical protein
MQVDKKTRNVKPTTEALLRFNERNTFLIRFHMICKYTKELEQK